MKLTKETKSQVIAHGDYANIANNRTKIPLIFRRIFGIFAVFQNFYLFIPRFLMEPRLGKTELN
jgi:hypothetical protein